MLTEPDSHSASLVRSTEPAKTKKHGQKSDGQESANKLTSEISSENTAIDKDSNIPKRERRIA